MNIYFSYIGAAIAVLNLLWLSWSVFVRRIPPTSPASWFMWAVLDSLLTWTSYVAAPTELNWLLPFGWTIGAVLCTIATFARGKWTWSWKETLCAICAGIAAYFWLTISAFAGVIAGTFAITLAGIPLAMDMFNAPIRGTFPVWMLTVLSCAFMLIGSDSTVIGVFLPSTSIMFNVMLAGFVLKK